MANNIQKLLNFFRIGKTENGKHIVPTEPKNKDKDSCNDKYVPINLPTDVQKIYQYIVDNLNIGIYRANQFRFVRYKDMKYAVTVEPLLNSAVKVYVSEAYNPQDGKKPIQIHSSDKKVEQLFYDWINDIGLTDSVVRSDLYNLCVYGDSFWINDIDFEGNSGVKGITTLDPFLVKNRLEFDMGMVDEMKQWGTSSINMVNMYGSLRDILDTIKGEEIKKDISAFYKTYCFGYELKYSVNDDENGKVNGVPPWMITHTRLYTTDRDFYPFGRPLLFTALPAFKSYRTTQTLVDMLRVASFPKEKVVIKGDEGMNPFTRFDRVDDVRQFIEGMSVNAKGDDSLGSVGERYYTLEDLFDIEQIDNDIDLDKLGDLEFKKNDMIASTGIARAYLDPSSDDFSLGGESGEALKYLCKIFDRKCEELREAELESIANLFRMHLMLTQTADGEKTEFELSIPNSIEDMNSDEIDEISSSFELAKDIIDAISTCAGLERGETIYKEIVKDIMRTYLPVESKIIDKWINRIYKDAEEQKENEPIGDDEESGTPKDNVIGKKGNFFEQRKKITELMNNGKIDEIYFAEKKKRGITDGDFGNRTFFNNTYRFRNDKTNSIYLLKEEINNRNMKRIEESVK